MYVLRISYLCDFDLPQFFLGVWCSNPQWWPHRKTVVEQKWSQTDPWPIWSDPSHPQEEGYSGNTSGCCYTAILHHAAPGTTSREWKLALTDFSTGVVVRVLLWTCNIVGPLSISSEGGKDGNIYVTFNKLFVNIKDCLLIAPFLMLFLLWYWLKTIL